jgi:hypothetical protein
LHLRLDWRRELSLGEVELQEEVGLADASHELEYQPVTSRGQQQMRTLAEELSAALLAERTTSQDAFQARN